MNTYFDAELEKLVRELMQKYNVHAVGYALIDNYEIVSVKTIQEKQVINTSALFQACSMSKSVTAFAVLDLVANNKVKLDSPVNLYLESWKIPDSIYDDHVTVRHCLNMTSGLCFGDAGTIFSGYTRQDPVPTLLEILCGLSPATNPPVKIIYEPGSQYYYSGASYMVLQQLIEDTVKQPFSSYLNTNILPRLNMINSIFECPLSADRCHQAIPGYKMNGEQIEGGWHHIVGAASGGLWSCPLDIANFMIYIAKLYENKNDNSLHAVIKEMFSAHQNTDYGLGLVIDGNEDTLNFRKNGHNAGYHNELIMFPNCGKGLVVMTNSAIGIELINELIVFVGENAHWPCYKNDFNELVSAPIRKK